MITIIIILVAVALLVGVLIYTRPQRMILRAMRSITHIGLGFKRSHNISFSSNPFRRHRHLW